MLLISRGVKIFNAHYNCSVVDCLYAKNEEQVRDNVDTCNHEIPCTHFLSPPISLEIYIRNTFKIVADYEI